MDAAICKFIFLGLQLVVVAANTTQIQDLNKTSSVKSRRQDFMPPPEYHGGQTMPPHGGPHEYPGGQMMPPPDGPQSEGMPPRSDVGHVNEAVLAAATRFTRPPMTTMRFHRSTLKRVSFEEDCDYLAHYCLKAYDTGKLCGRTLYYKYYSFKNYCLLDYVNCMERYEHLDQAQIYLPAQLWQVVHMGECFDIKPLTEYVMYPYDDDHFLDQYYIVEDN